MSFFKIIITCFILTFFSVPAYSENDFPGRDKYPDTPYISQSDFYNGYKKGIKKYYFMEGGAKYYTV